MYYLYIKTHNITGLKYLGVTIQNPFTYKGSGIKWTAHLRKHGNDVSTELVGIFQSEAEVREAGNYYSNQFNIVESKEWANLMPEDGSGYFKHMTSEQRRVFSTGKKYSVETNAKKGSPGIKNPMYGKKRHDVTIRNQCPKAWVTNGSEDRFIMRSQLAQYIANNYRIGRVNHNTSGSQNG